MVGERKELAIGGLMLIICSGSMMPGIWEGEAFWTNTTAVVIRRNVDEVRWTSERMQRVSIINQR